MGLLNWRKSRGNKAVSSKISLMLCEKLSPIDIDIDAELKKSIGSSTPSCIFLFDTDDYCFYKYIVSPDSAYIIRRSKSNQLNVVFFGRCRSECCIYKGYIFQWERNFSFHLDRIEATNTHTGNTIVCDWLGKGYIKNPENAHKYVMQDTINSVHETGGRLLFTITRKKSLFFTTYDYPDDYDFDTDYTLSVILENNVFKAVRSFPRPAPTHGVGARFCLPKTFVSNGTEKQKVVIENSTPRSGLSVQQANDGSVKQETSHLLPPGTEMKLPLSMKITCENLKSSGRCNNQCEKCIVKTSLPAIMKVHQHLPDIAISEFLQIISTNPDYAEIWCNLGKAYMQKEDYVNAIASFDKAIHLLPTYGEAYLCRAIALAGNGRNIEAYNLTKALIATCDDSGAKVFLRTLPQERVKELGLTDPLWESKKVAPQAQANITAGNSTSDEDY